MAVYTTIDNPELYFQTKLWTGDDSTDNAITFDNTDTSMQPDLIWLKPRTKVDNHRLMDSVRGVTKMSPTNSTGAEETISAGLASFDSNGFTLNTTDSGYNSSSYTYVAWCWKESATAGFDIVTFVGNQTARTISHSLSAKPEWLLIKNREKVESWHTQHGALGATQTQEFNTTGAFGTGSTIWNDTEPTTSVFSVGNNGNINETDSNILVYLFAGKQGFSKFGKYTGNGNADGTFVYTGFRPAFILAKSTAATTWEMVDNKRLGYNSSNWNLFPNTTAVENADTVRLDILSNGFKIRTTGSNLNTSGTVYVYMAFAEAPFVNSNGVPCNAR